VERRLARQLVLGAGLTTVALVVRLRWMPLERHRFKGHELQYLEVFQQRWQEPWSARVVAPLGALYQLLGQVSQDPRLLMGIAVAAGLLSIAALCALTWRLAGEKAAWLAGLLLTLHGGHAFWSTSIYHVIHPQLLLLAACALLCFRGWAACAGAAVCFGLAAGMRPELMACLPALALLAWARPLRQRLTMLGCATALALLTAWPLLAPGAHAEGLLEDAPRALAANLRQLRFLAPWASPWILGAAILLAVPGLKRWPRAGRFFALLGGGSYLGAACFADMGFRHVLPAVAALCALQACGLVAALDWAGARGTRKQAMRALALLALAPPLVHLADVARRYYASTPEFMLELTAAAQGRELEILPHGTCRRVSEEHRMPGQRGISHLQAAPGEQCLFWVEDLSHQQWTSLATRDRALRMHALYELEPLGLHRQGREGGQPRMIWGVVRRKALWRSLGFDGL